MWKSRCPGNISQKCTAVLFAKLRMDVFPWNWLYQRDIETKLLRKETSKRYLSLVNRKLFKKRYQNDHDFFSFQKHVKISTMKLCRFSIHQCSIKKVQQNYVDFSSMEITSKNVHRNDVDFSPIENMSKRVRWKEFDYMPINIMFEKAHQKNVEFCLSKLRRRKYVDTTSIFCPSKPHQTGTSKWRENSSIFYFARINVIFTANQRQVDVLCQTSSNFYVTANFEKKLHQTCRTGS